MHEWNEFVQTIAPTCEEAGVKTRTCKLCLEKDSTTEAGEAALGHSFPEEWTVIESATTTEDGSEELKCDKCETHANDSPRVIPATGDNGNGEPSPWDNLPGTEVTLEYRTEDNWEGYYIHIDVSELGLTETITIGETYILDITGYFNQEIDALLTSLLQYTEEEEFEYITSGKYLDQNVSANEECSNLVAFVIEEIIDNSVFLSITVELDSAITEPVKFKYTKLTLTKQTKKHLILNYKSAWDTWGDDYRIANLGIDNVSAGKKYKVTITGKSNFAVELNVMLSDADNGWINISQYSAFFPVIPKDTTFTTSTILNVTQNGTGDIRLNFGVRGADYNGTTPIIIECDTFTIEETDNLQLIANRWGEGKSSWSSNILLKDFYSQPLEGNTTYSVTISGTSDIAMNAIFLMFFTYDFIDLGIWDGHNNNKTIPKGAFSLTVNLTTKDTAFLKGHNLENVLLLIVNENAVPESIATGTLMATITNFNVVITK
jgi:hypothetical protein